MNKDKLFSYFSAIGRSLMMPLAALSVAGILLGLTSALKNPKILEAAPFLTNTVVAYIINMLNSVASAVYTIIPVLFAVSISLGLAKEKKEIAAFAGFVGYYTFLVSTKTIVGSGFINTDAFRITPILGVETVDMGALAGIMTGLIVAYLHNKFHKIKFHDAVAFYGGTRFVAIIVILVMTIVGQFMPLIWYPISNGINSLGTLISNAQSFGVFLFGFLERFLIPTGLHHILNGIFRTTPIGGVYEGVEGALNIFTQFVGKVDAQVLAPYTRYLGQGKYVFMMFGLPAAALAIYQTTPDEKKQRVGALMIASVSAAFISGITEPIEFAFMFVAFPLFVFHSIMAGLSFMFADILGVVVGTGGSGLINLIIWGVIQPGSNWIRLIMLGIPYALIYYYVFKWYFTRKKLVIDVSDEDSFLDQGQGDKSETGAVDAKSLRIIEGLGGFDNILTVDNCISRLRVDLKDISLLDEAILKSTGAMGIIKVSDIHVHVVYGPAIEAIAEGVKTIMKY